MTRNTRDAAIFGICTKFALRSIGIAMPFSPTAASPLFQYHKDGGIAAIIYLLELAGKAVRFRK